jgi:hypothetical protein
LDLYVLIGILIFISLAAAGLVPLLMFLKVRIRTIRILSLLLGLFAVIHGLYHLSVGLGNDFFGDIVFEPVSVSILVAFGLYYSKKGIA